MNASAIVGARCLLVHPIDGEAEAFYAGYGFRPLPGEQKTFFLPLDTIAQGDALHRRDFLQTLTEL